MYMRHVQLKPIQISSWLKVLQQTAKITTGRSPNRICKEFLGLLPKVQYHRLLHMYDF